MLSCRKAALFSAAFFLLAGAGGCSHQAWLSPQELAGSIAAKAGLESRRLDTGQFLLTSFQSIGLHTDDTLAVYIEGDGASWVSPQIPPADPTPTNPVALILASRDAHRPVAYIARPCQYLDKSGLSSCHPRYWTGSRFSSEAIAAIDTAVSAAKRSHGARQVRLVGFSGGGVVAALVALRRKDVESLITVAAPLDIAAWAAFHQITPLSGSLNPADSMAALAGIRQMHLAGEKDSVVPLAYIEKLQERMPFARFRIIPGYNHACCWAENWPTLADDALK